jgi:hypothetical protein
MVLQHGGATPDFSRGQIPAASLAPEFAGTLSRAPYGQAGDAIQLEAASWLANAESLCGRLCIKELSV